jgi:hypothetical protein
MSFMKEMEKQGVRREQQISEAWADIEYPDDEDEDEDEDFDDERADVGVGGGGRKAEEKAKKAEKMEAARKRRRRLAKAKKSAEAALKESNPLTEGREGQRPAFYGANGYTAAGVLTVCILLLFFTTALPACTYR